MASLTPTDVQRIRDGVFFEGPEAGRRYSRFWMLLVLAGIIATAGVIADSTATVIGAMIVAPLMTPILGIVVAIILGDRANLLRSVMLVIGGAASVVLIGYLLGHTVSYDVVAAVNGQVAGRVSPRLIDLIAALATGAVGSVALARSDISDTLPGVAIAISLVPPLAVVGLTLEAGATGEAAGALLLFGTNVAAILASGIVVMAIYRAWNHAPDVSDTKNGIRRRYPIALVVVMVAIVAVPLAISSKRIANTTVRDNTVQRVTNDWATTASWRVLSVDDRPDSVLIRVTGPSPEPDTARLRVELDAAGLSKTTVSVELVPENLVVLPGK